MRLFFLATPGWAFAELTGLMGSASQEEAGNLARIGKADTSEDDRRAATWHHVRGITPFSFRPR